jgi:hypothetical protein
MRLFPSVILALLTCVGCSVNQPPLPTASVAEQRPEATAAPRPERASPHSYRAICSDSDILAKASSLSGFDPTQTNANYALPNFGMLSGDQYSALAKALAYAPDDLKNALCSNLVDTIGVVQDPQPAAYAYAFWESRQQAARHGRTRASRFIGIPSSVLYVNDSMNSFDRAEADLIVQVLKENGLTSPSQIDVITNLASAGFSPYARVVSAIAHEVGHLIWHFAGGPFGTGGPHGRVCSPSGRNFSDAFWAPGHVAEIPNSYHRFGVPFDGNRHRDPASDPSVSDITQQAIQNNYGPLKTLLESAHFVTLLGAVDVDDEFAETYRYFMLRQAPINLQSRQVNFPDRKTANNTYSNSPSDRDQCTIQLQNVAAQNSLQSLRRSHRHYRGGADR